MDNHRYLSPYIREFLKKKMVFISGPRQVGKTTLSLSLVAKNATESHPAYLNWDSPGIAQKLKNGYLPPHQKILILDEIHKFQRWQSLVKGIYDSHKSHLNLIVTGSARLDHFKKGGDSL